MYKTMSKRKAPSMTGGKSFRHDSESENESENGFESGSGDDLGGEFSDDNEPEEEGNGNDDFSSDEESDVSEEDLSQRSAPDAATSVPLYKRLAEQSTDDALTAVARERVKKRRIRDSAKGNNRASKINKSFVLFCSLTLRRVHVDPSQRPEQARREWVLE